MACTATKMAELLPERLGHAEDSCINVGEGNLGSVSGQGCLAHCNGWSASTHISV